MTENYYHELVEIQEDVIDVTLPSQIDECRSAYLRNPAFREVINYVITEHMEKERDRYMVAGFFVEHSGQTITVDKRKIGWPYTDE